ncbi:MAG: hypothetical protein K2L56_03045 [Prevotella sp.]|nr:hypothetical protein [Prevotella sp.]
MKSVKYLFLAATLMALFAAPEASAKRKLLPKSYMFGFSASFRDSTVYFTDIQSVDSTWIETKGNMLLGRNVYSYQLKNYMNELGMPHRTCIVMFAEKRKDAEKKLMKLRHKYTGKAKNQYDVKVLTDKDFSFRPVSIDIIAPDEEIEAPQPKSHKRKK